jgi:glycosyltransferase involved in cell wall biosynthesis
MSPSAIAAGYDDIVSVPESCGGRTVDIVVRARSLNGEEWVSEPTSVAVALPAPPVGELDQLTTFHTAKLSSVGGYPESQRRTRVCVFTHSLNLGGGELYLQELVLRLVRDYACELLVVAPSDGPLRKELREAGILVHVTGHYAADAEHYLGRVSELGAILSLWEPDAVLANTLGVFPAVDAALGMGLPTFWAIHESFTIKTWAYLNWGEQGVHPQVEQRWRRCLSGARSVFESQATLSMYKEQIPDLQGTVVRYGIDRSSVERYRGSHHRNELRTELGFRSEQRVALCMGVFNERKATLALVVAFAEVAELFPAARLVLVGDHPTEYARLVGFAVGQLGLSDQVRIEPIQPDTYRWYSVADILVSASDTESLPRSLLEAMSFGVPALAADVFGLSEVIRDGENGWLCRGRSRASLVAGLRRAFGCSDDELETLSAQCEIDAQHFDAAHYAAEYSVLIEAAVAARRAKTEAADAVAHQ